MPAPDYSIFEYRAMSDPIRQEKGHMLLRNNKHYASRRAPGIYLFGLHIAVVRDDTVLPDESARALNEYGATTTRDASWHVGVDTDSICVGLPDWYTAWVQGVSGFNFNSPGLGAEVATLQTDWRKIPAWRQYRFLRHLAAWYAPRVLKYRNKVALERNRTTVQANINANKPAGFAYHGDLDIANRTDPGLVNPGRIDTFPIAWFLELVEDEINIILGYHGDVYNSGRKYRPYVYGARPMTIFCVGEDVTQWQKNLNAAGFKTGIDGSFGPDCEAKTLAFQAANGLVEDGAAGPGSQAKMKALLSKPEPAPKPVVAALPSNISVKRVGGTSRYDTNVNLISQRGEGGSNKAYVVSGESFPDGLGVSSLGDGVVFLTKQTAMPSKTLKALVAFKPSSVVVCGGPASVSDTVIRQLKG